MPSIPAKRPRLAAASMPSPGFRCRILVLRPQLFDPPQLHADPALAFGEIGGALAVLAARPERHPVGLAQDAHDVVERPLLLPPVGDTLGDRLDGEDVGALDLGKLPGMIRLRLRPARRCRRAGAISGHVAVPGVRQFRSAKELLVTALHPAFFGPTLHTGAGVPRTGAGDRAPCVALCRSAAEKKGLARLAAHTARRHQAMRANPPTATAFGTARR
jgi:hypothetical protein